MQKILMDFCMLSLLDVNRAVFDDLMANFLIEDVSKYVSEDLKF